MLILVGLISLPPLSTMALPFVPTDLSYFGSAPTFPNPQTSTQDLIIAEGCLASSLP